MTLPPASTHAPSRLPADPATSDANEPLLRADSVRIDMPRFRYELPFGSTARIDPLVENVTMATSGANVAFVGAPRAVFEASIGLIDVTAGSLRVCGMAPRDAARSGAIASAPIDVALPPRWTVLDLAVENARLAGHGRSERERLALAAIRAMQLDAYARSKLGPLDAAVRRAAVLAAALATDAPALFVEDFTPGLADGAARMLARVFVTACRGRRWALFAGRLALASPLGLAADEAILFSGGRFACAGIPAEIATRERTYSLRTSAPSAEPLAFAEKLRERGAEVEADATGRALTVTIPEGFSTLELVTLAHASNVVVLELQPLSGGVG